jgi:dolichyl-phosphate beta-glucosyltransferase
VSYIVIVVPCYNEEKRLDSGAFSSFRLDGHRVELCFVNDGSSDGTLALLESLRQSEPDRFSILDLERNGGKAEAVRRGIVHAAAKNPDAVGFWDADLATPLSEIPSFVDVLESRPEIQMVFGARVRLLGRDIVRRTGRHYVGRVGATLISSTLGLPIYDTQCGAKLFRMTEALPAIFSTAFLSRWIFDVEIIARFIERVGRERASLSIYEIPIRSWHDVGGSKVKSRDFLRALRDLWKIRQAYRLGP